MAAGQDWPFSAAQIAIREGVNASDALRAFRAGGGRVRTQTWYRLYGQAQLEGALAGPEASAALNRVPVSSELQTRSVPRARGYMQRVTVFGRTDAGDIVTREVSLRSTRLVSRGNAIAKALALVQAGMEDPEARDRYPLRQLLMGTYTGTVSFEPLAE